MVFSKKMVLVSSILLLQACGGSDGDNKPAASNLASAYSNSQSLVSSSVASSAPTSSSSLSSALANSSLFKSSAANSSSPINISLLSSSASSSSLAVASNTLKISGTLVADALAGASIDVTLGTQHFSAQADAQRNYQVTLDATETNLHQPIMISAQGFNTNTQVKFASLLPSIKSAKILAGADNTLDASEFIGVNLSPMSTAEYALAHEFNPNISSDAERTAALISISAQQHRFGNAEENGNALRGSKRNNRIKSDI